MDQTSILHELAQCREDERASKALIFQVLSATAAFLPIVTVVSSALTNTESSLFSSSDGELYLFLYILSILVVSAAVSYVANLGFLSPFRHHYMVDLENQLAPLPEEASKQMLHWETVSKPVITLNPNHIGSGIFSLFSINIGIAFFTIITLAIVFVLIQFHIVLKRASHFFVVACCCLAFFALVVLICFITILVSTLHSKELYQRAREKAIFSRLKQGPPLAHGNIIFYFLYPRIKDIQKCLFIFLGYFMGCALLCADTGTEFTLSISTIIESLPLFFVLDILVYQARYLWNDIRGAHEDLQHPLSDKRGRLPTKILRFKPAIRIASIVMILRIVAAALIVWFLIEPTQTWPLGICSVLVFGLGFLYELAREKRWPRATIYLVGLGYPLRVVAGLWYAHPAFWKTVSEHAAGSWNGKNILFLLILIVSIWAFGVTFVTMTWVLEAASNPNTEKRHLTLLHEQLTSSTEVIEATKPILGCKTLNCYWNGCYGIAHVALCVTTFLFFSPDRTKVVASILISTVCLLPLCIRRYTMKATICTAAAALAVGGVHFFMDTGPNTYALFVLLEGLQLGYLVIYGSFRNSNYEDLYSALDNFIKMITTIIGFLRLRLIYLFLGRGTAREFGIVMANLNKNEPAITTEEPPTETQQPEELSVHK